MTPTGEISERIARPEAESHIRRLIIAYGRWIVADAGGCVLG